MKSIANSFDVAVAELALPRHRTAASTSDQTKTAAAMGSGPCNSLPVIDGIYGGESSKGEIACGSKRVDTVAGLIRAAELGVHNTGHGTTY